MSRCLAVWGDAGSVNEVASHCISVGWRVRLTVPACGWNGKTPAGAGRLASAQAENLEFRKVSSALRPQADYYKEPAREGWRGC